MPGKMIERLAIAIYEAGREWYPDKIRWDEIKDIDSWTCQDHYRVMAKAVLKELMEPTDEMVEAGHMVTGQWWDIKGSGLTIKRVKMKMRWQGMIKEALNDEKL